MIATVTFLFGFFLGIAIIPAYNRYLKERHEEWRRKRQWQAYLRANPNWKPTPFKLEDVDAAFRNIYQFGDMTKRIFDAFEAQAKNEPPIANPDRQVKP